MSSNAAHNDGVAFLRWALPRLGYRWPGFRKPRGQVLKRIRDRMQELRLSGGYGAYQSYLEQHPEEWEQLDRLCFVTVSKFFRDRRLWDFLRDEILAELVQRDRAGPVVIWSAGCCNGEEPYSLAMICEQLKAKDPGGREVSVLASERIDEVLRRARAARYPAGALKELEEREIERYFKRLDGEEDPCQVKSLIREQVRFEQRDIRESLPDATFELVLCRNLVFTYFDREHQVDFLDRLKAVLDLGGYFVIGANEKLPDVDWMEPVGPRYPVFRRVD